MKNLIMVHSATECVICAKSLKGLTAIACKDNPERNHFTLCNDCFVAEKKHVEKIDNGRWIIKTD